MRENESERALKLFQYSITMHTRQVLKFKFAQNIQAQNIYFVFPRTVYTNLIRSSGNVVSGSAPVFSPKF